MAFHFSLEAVLHYRRSLERQQELRLRAANQLVARTRHLAEQIAHRIQQGRLTQSEQLSAGMTAAELQFALDRETALDRQRQSLEHELSRLENLRDQQQRIFQQARRERETFESLKEQERRTYAIQAARREQRQMDDLFLLRRAYLRRAHLRHG